MGLLKKAASGVLSPFIRAHVLRVRSARKNGCGLAGRTFLNDPKPLVFKVSVGLFALGDHNYSALPESQVLHCNMPKGFTKSYTKMPQKKFRLTP